jgi:hypothetical protein
LLIALRYRFPQPYKQIPDDVKAVILCSSLSHVARYNDWGHISGPPEKDEHEAAIALLETGPASMPYLVSLLDDCRPARFGGTGHMTRASYKYQYRIADYAYLYICLIMNWQHVFHPTPDERDKEIERIKIRCTSLQLSLESLQ